MKIASTRTAISAALLILAAGGVLLAASSESVAPPPGGRLARGLSDKQNAGSLLAPEKGKFKIFVNGQQIGKEEFEIGPSGADWTVRGNSEIQSPQGNTHVSGTLNLKADGTPVHYQWSMQGPKKASAEIAFKGTVADVELHLENARPYTQQFTFNSPQVLVLDNNLYHQYVVLARLYDWNKKGSQSFAVLVPQEMTPGNVTVDSLGKQDVGGGVKLEELRVKTEDLELDLYLDGQKLVRITAPSSNAEIVRE
jgi:hypothetical protein